MGKTPHLNMKKKIERLVCIYEVLGELVFKYWISGCSRGLTLETIMNPLQSQIQPRQLFSSHLNHVSLYYRVSQKRHSYKIFGLEIMLFTCSQT